MSKKPGLKDHDDPMLDNSDSDDINNRDRGTMKRVGFAQDQRNDRSGSKYGNQGGGG